MCTETENHLPGLTDSHCHLSCPQFSAKIDAVLDRADRAGLRYLLTVGQGLQDCARAIELAREYPKVYAAVGFGPHGAQEMSDKHLLELADLASEPKVLAIGETGLDYYYGRDSRDIQKAVFAQQVDLAASLHLPLIIHCRDAWDDCLAVLERVDLGPRPGVFHCYTGSAELVPEIIERGFYISFAGMVTFRNADTCRAAAEKVPSQRLLIETDAPYLCPEPLRKIKTNEPAFLVHTACFLAQLLDVSPSQLAQITTTNAVNLFGLPPDSD